jgi:hypothetical protein
MGGGVPGTQASQSGGQQQAGTGKYGGMASQGGGGNPFQQFQGMGVQQAGQQQQPFQGQQQYQPQQYQQQPMQQYQPQQYQQRPFQAQQPNYSALLNSLASMFGQQRGAPSYNYQPTQSANNFQLRNTYQFDPATDPSRRYAAQVQAEAQQKAAADAAAAAAAANAPQAPINNETGGGDGSGGGDGGDAGGGGSYKRGGHVNPNKQIRAALLTAKGVQAKAVPGKAGGGDVAPALPSRVTDRRIPELQDAADMVAAGHMGPEEYHAQVGNLKPVRPYTSLPPMATREDLLRGLSKDKHAKIGAEEAIPEGHAVGLRLDIPAYNKHGVWAPTIHEGHEKNSKPIAHAPFAHVSNPVFSVDAGKALGVARGNEKAPFAKINGFWKKTSPEDAQAMAQEYLNHPEWRQVGMDPERHSFFYDRETRQPVVSADEALQIGPLVLAKNPKYGSLKDFQYENGGRVGSPGSQYEQGGRVGYGGGGVTAYHGSFSPEIKSFDPKRKGENFPNKSSMQGAWFSTNPDDAEFYGDKIYKSILKGNFKAIPSMEELGEKALNRLREISVSSKVKYETRNAASKVVDYYESTKDPKFYTGVAAAAINKAKKEGYDGAKLVGGEKVQDQSNPGDNYVVFNPGSVDFERIRAAGGSVEEKQGRVGYAGGGGEDDPTVQKALGLTQQVQPSASQMAQQVLPQAQPSAVDDHPAWIPTRLVTSKKAVTTPGEKNIVDLESMRQTPKLFQQNVDLVRAYPNTPTSMSNASHDDMAEHFINHVKDNLLSLHDAVPEEIRGRSKLWYDGARNIVDQWSKKYNLPDHSIAAALAALSPQKDWYQNVSLAERVLDGMRGKGENFYHGFAFNKDMENTFNNIEAFAQPKYSALLDVVRGKSLGDLGKLNADEDTKAAAKALWLRLHDETYNDRSHRIITPEGNFGDFVKTMKGENAGTGWGSLVEIGKAIRSIEAAQNPELISALMGEKHKVRNFYNNILAPRSPNGDVTIDTHAVAAGLYRPLSGKSLEVAHNFANYAGKGVPGAAGSAISGIQGTYPLYAEAYRRAAKERGILPREMQSITWEAVRGLFPESFKTAANSRRVDAVWNRYKNGEISQDNARRLVDEIAGGIRNPTWVMERGAGPNEAGQAPNDAGILSGRGLRGSPSEGAFGGTGDGSSSAIPAVRSQVSALPKSDSSALIDKALQLTRKART